MEDWKGAESREKADSQQPAPKKPIIKECQIVLMDVMSAVQRCAGQDLVASKGKDDSTVLNTGDSVSDVDEVDGIDSHFNAKKKLDSVCIDSENIVPVSPPVNLHEIPPSLPCHTCKGKFICNKCIQNSFEFDDHTE